MFAGLPFLLWPKSSPTPNLTSSNITEVKIGGQSLHLNVNTFIEQGKEFRTTGPVTFQNQTNSTSAFAVQTASSADVLAIDTTNSKIGINTAPSATGASLQVAGNVDISGQYLINGQPLSLSGVAGAANATLQGNTFNGSSQLVRLTAGGVLPALSGANLTSLNASNLSSGTLADARLSTNATLQGNTFNGASQLVQLDSSGILPALNGSALTNVNAITLQGNGSSYYTNASNISSGILADSRLSANVALLNANQTFTGSNIFSGPFKFQSATNAQNAFQIQNQAGNDNLLIADTINTRIGIGLATPNYTLDVNGDVNIANNQVYRINGVTVCSNVGCTPNGNSNAYVQIQASTPGSAQTGNLNITGAAIAGTFAGSGLGLTNLDASQLAAGTVNDLRLSSNVTLQGNTFNGASQLVQTTALSYFPALNGSLVTNLNASALTTGTVDDARLTNNVALLDRTGQTFSGTNIFQNALNITSLTNTNNGHTIAIGFSGTSTGAVTYNFDNSATPATYTICSTAGNCAGSGGGVTTPGGTINRIAKFSGAQTLGDSQILDNGSQVLINQLTGTYQLDVAGDINSTTGLRVGGNLLCTSTGCGAAAGSGNYIQNGTGLQTGANFNIRSASSAGVVAVLEGASGQTADILDVQGYNGGTKYLAVTTTGASITGNLNVSSQYQIGGVQITSAVLSNNANLAKIDAANNFTGANIFKNTGTTAFQIQKSDGSGTVLIADTSNTRIGIGIQPAYTLDVAGDVNISTGSFYRVNGVAICGSAATCAPSSGSTNYIQNSVAQQTSANFNIQSTATGSIVGILQGKSGQTADILDLKDGSANLVLSVGNQGQTLVKDSSAGSATFFQIQNSSSVSLLTANTTTGQILFPNATLSSTALLLGGDANLYRSAASTLKTDNNLIVAGSSVVGEASINPTYKLEVAGSINLTSGNSYYIGGTPICSSSGCAPTSGSNNYVQLQSSTPGTQQTGNLNISGTGLFGGNVGIGISPSYKLDVAGDINTSTYLRASGYAMDATPTSYGTFGLASAKGSYYGLLMGQTTSNANLMYDGSGNGGIYYQGTGTWEQYYLASNAHLNINTSSDLGATLGVSGTGYFTGTLQAAGNIYGPGFRVSNDVSTIQDSNQFWCNNSSTCYFNYSSSGATYVGNTTGVYMSGNVGIGTSSFTTGSGKTAKLFIDQPSASQTALAIDSADTGYFEEIQRSGYTLFQMFANNTGSPGTHQVVLSAPGNGTLGIASGFEFESGNVCVQAPLCTHTLGVAGSIGASGSITASTTPDLSETIPAAPDVETADVVSADPGNTEAVIKSQKAYDSTAVGVISDGTSSFMINSHANSESAGLTGKPLVLAGRVPVKVTGEGGAIKPGDYLTTSSTAGYAMKATQAGATIGKALGFFSGTSLSDKGTVLVLVNLSYYDPIANELQGGTLDTTNVSLSGDLTVAGTATFKGDIVVDGHIIGNSDTGGSLSVPAGQTTASYSFAKPFTSTPKVVASPTDNLGGISWWVTKTANNFTLHLSAAAPNDLNFDYMVQQ